MWAGNGKEPRENKTDGDSRVKWDGAWDFEIRGEKLVKSIVARIKYIHVIKISK